MLASTADCSKFHKLEEKRTASIRTEINNQTGATGAEHIFTLTQQEWLGPGRSGLESSWILSEKWIFHWCGNKSSVLEPLKLDPGGVQLCENTPAGDDFLQKPFAEQTILTFIQRILFIKKIAKAKIKAIAFWRAVSLTLDSVFNTKNPSWKPVRVRW